MTHDELGHRNDQESSSRKERGISRLYNLQLLPDVSLTAEGGFPILEPYTGSIDFEFINFGERKKANPTKSSIHFFMDDFKFQNILDKRIEEVTMELTKFPLLFSPDYSLYADAPELINQMQKFKSQLIGAY